MSDSFFNFMKALSEGTHVAYLSLWLSMVRPLALMSAFVAFGWANLSHGVVRGGIGLALAIPVGVGIMPQIDADADFGIAFTLCITFKEIFLGLVLGFAASAPIWAAQLAGEVIDAFRGENAGGLPDPEGGEVTAYGILFFGVAVWLFASFGGFWQLAAALYNSYGVWPALSPFPSLTAEGAVAAMAVVESLLSTALILAAPILIVLFSVEIVILIASRIGRQFDAFTFSMAFKSLLSLLLLPVFAMALVRVLKGEFLATAELASILEVILR